MGLQIKEDKAREWVRSGAPTNALDYLGDTVKSMADFAETNDILHKNEGENDVEHNSVAEDVNVTQGSDTNIDTDTSQNADVSEDKEVVDTEKATDNVTNEVETNEETSKEQSVDTEATTVDANPDVLVAFSKSLNDTIAVAIKTYHDEVVVPLQKALETVTNGTQKSASTVSHPNSMFEHLLGEDWLPASVMANTIKEQFAASDTSDGDETVTDSQVKESAAAVDEVLSNGEGGKYNVPGHLFNDF